MVERSDKTWSTGEGNGKPLQYSCLENPINSMKRQKDITWMSFGVFQPLTSKSKLYDFARFRLELTQLITLDNSSYRFKCKLPEDKYHVLVVAVSFVHDTVPRKQWLLQFQLWN